MPVRARALSARGAYIVTSAPARLGDTVHVSVSCAGRTALVRGTVYHVTTADDAVSTGASGFAVRFPEYACPARTHLVQVLLAARGRRDLAAAAQPDLGAVSGALAGAARRRAGAVPRRGAGHLGRRHVHRHPAGAREFGTEIRFAMPLNLAEVPIGAGPGRPHPGARRRRAARHAPGFGARILAMNAANRIRWDAFVGRVRRRTEKRILVGASPGRVEELAAGLFAAGYTVTSGSDLGLLMRVAELDPCPPDIAVIDADFDRTAAPSGWNEQVFASRQVQCVTCTATSGGPAAWSTSCCTSSLEPGGHRRLPSCGTPGG